MRCPLCNAECKYGKTGAAPFHSLKYQGGYYCTGCRTWYNITIQTPEKNQP